MKIFLIGIFILGITSIPSLSFAEIQIQVQEEEISVETNPSNPEPYQDVTITLSSYATDLNRAIIRWENNTGTTLLSGIGQKSYSFKTEGPNTSIVFNISITPVGSVGSIEKTVVITPSEIEIMWESVDGYTPPFYKGKSLPVSGSYIKTVAIPNTNTIKSGSGSLAYTWKNSDNTVLEASGYNKNSYTFKNSMFDESNTITVIASSVNSNYKAEKTIEIPVYKPKIVFYKKSPTEGVIYNNALGSETEMKEDEITIVAEPYFTTIKEDDKDFVYKWQVNEKGIPTPSKKTELTLRPTSKGGYALVNVSIENVRELFQKVSGKLKLNL